MRKKVVDLVPNGASPIVQTLPAIPDLTFCQALEKVIEGKLVTKREWNNKSFYLVLQDTRLRIHKPDGKFYDLVVTDGDIAGEDYYVIE